VRREKTGRREDGKEREKGAKASPSLSPSRLPVFLFSPLFLK
jgi:hypothetical protein